jgi:hypothetical protein
LINVQCCVFLGKSSLNNTNDTIDSICRRQKDSRTEKNDWIAIAKDNKEKLKTFIESHKPSKSLPSIGESITQVYNYNDTTTILDDEERSTIVNYLCAAYSKLRMPTTEVTYLVHDTVAYLVNGFRLNEQSVDNPIMEQEQDVRNVNTDHEMEATVVNNEINRKEKNITISEIKLPVKRRIKGRPKGRNQTVIGLLKKSKSGKKQGPKPFFKKSNKDKEKGK